MNVQTYVGNSALPSMNYKLPNIYAYELPTLDNVIQSFQCIRVGEAFRGCYRSLCLQCLV